MNSKQFTFSRLGRFISLTAVAAAVCVVFAGPAAAKTLLPAPTQVPDAFERAVQAHKSAVQVQAPDAFERAVQAHKSQGQVLAPDDRNRVIQTPASSSYTSQGLAADGRSKTTSSGSGFDWSDGGIGAAGGLVLLLASTGLIFVVRRNRHQQIAV